RVHARGDRERPRRRGRNLQEQVVRGASPGSREAGAVRQGVVGMSHEDDRFAAYLRGAAHDYNNPPSLSKGDMDELWSSIEEESFGKRPFVSPTASIGRRPARDLWSIRTLLPLAAVLVLGIAIGRYAAPRKQA